MESFSTQTTNYWQSKGNTIILGLNHSFGCWLMRIGWNKSDLVTDWSCERLLHFFSPQVVQNQPGLNPSFYEHMPHLMLSRNVMQQRTANRTGHGVLHLTCICATWNVRNLSGISKIQWHLDLEGERLIASFFESLAV